MSESQYLTWKYIKTNENILNPYQLEEVVSALYTQLTGQWDASLCKCSGRASQYKFKFQYLEGVATQYEKDKQ